MIPRKFAVYCVILFSITAFSGCVTLKKGRPPKLFRGKGQEDKDSADLSGKAVPCSRVYKDAYVLWKVCQGELIEKLGLNKKKDISLRQRTIQNLERMQICLIGEKRDALTASIVKIKGLTKKLIKRRLTKIQIQGLKRELSRQKREIQRNFSYNKMSDWIKPDE